MSSVYPKKNKVRVGVVGLGFGKEFLPIYKEYENCEVTAICKRNKNELEEFGRQFEIDKLYTSYQDMLNDDDIDAIHIVTPIFDHAGMTIDALKAGKHCASTVPMATTIDELKEIVRLKNDSNKIYMMMETAVYTREFFYVKNLIDTGRLGKIQFLRGSHQQDMGLEGWPGYWLGLPPMWYGTHAIGPLLCIAGSRAESVVCHGSGKLSPDLSEKYNSPFSIETATFKLEHSPIAVEATRSLYECTRQYRESFDVYGEKMSCEWEQIADEGFVVFEGGENARRINVPDTDKLLPKSISQFSLREQILDEDHVSFIQGAGHGGSHPHLVREFIDSIMENREPREGVITSADWTAAGICAHESAMKNGERIYLPDFRDIK